MTVQEINGWNRVVPKIDFRTDLNLVGDWQRDREMSLQDRAGIDYSTNYEHIRRALAQQESEEGLSDMYAVAENSLKNGANPNTVASAIEGYTPAVSDKDLDVSLEVAAAEQQTIDANNTNPKTAMNNAVDGIDVSASQAQNEIFTNWRQDVKNVANSRPMLRKWRDAVETFSLDFSGIGFLSNKYEFGAAFPAVDLSGTYTLKSVTDKVRENIQQARNTMTPQEYHDYLYGMLEQWKRDPLINWGRLDSVLDDIYEGSTYTEDVLTAAGVLDTVVGGARNIYKGYKAAKQVGDINLLRRQAREAMEKGDTETIAKEFISPSAAKPVENTVEISSDDRILDMLGDRVSTLEAEAYVAEKQSTGIFSEEELQNLAKFNKKKIEEKYFKRGNTNCTDVYAKELDDGTVEVRGVIGDAEGNALSHDDAVRLAENMGLKEGEYSVVRKDNEGFFVEVGQKIDNPYDKIFYGNTFDYDEWTWKGGVRDWITRQFAGVLKVGKEAHARSLLADRKFNHIMRDMENKFTHSMYAMSKKEYKEFKGIIEKGLEGDGKWFTKDELINDLGATDKMVDAYFDYKTVQDIDYIARNAKLRRELVRKGCKNFGDNIIGYEEKIEKAYGSNYIIADADGQILDNAYISKLNPEEYVLVRTAKGRSVQDDLVASHVLLKRAEANERDLPKFVMNYTPGGRREYANGTIFIKNGRSWFNPTTGHTLNGYAKTLTTSMNMKDAKAYADEANEAIKIWNMDVSDVKKARLVAAKKFKYFKLENYEHLKQLMRTKENPTGLIDPRHNVQIIEKGGKYTYDNGLETFENILNDADWDLQDLLDNRAMYNRNRGNWLDALNGDKARIIDPRDIFDKTMQRAAYTLSKGDLENWYAREFEKGFKSVIDNWEDIKNLSPREMINAARVRDSMFAGPTDENKIRAAKRFIIKARVAFNGRTKADHFIDNNLTKLAKAVTGDWGREHGVYEGVKSLNPVRWARQLGFWQSMGMFNMSQFWKQGLGAAYVAGAHPLIAPKAMMAYVPIRNALSAIEKNDTELLKMFKPKIAKITGLTSAEVDDMLKYMTELGTKESSGLLIGNQARKGARVTHGFFSNLWDKQYMFMQEGNAFNYIVADTTSYIANRGKAWKEIAQHSDDLFLNMTKSNESAFQRGLDWPTSFMTQWMAYPTRSFEMMFNSRLGKMQRAGMLFSQFLMWGAGGIMVDEAGQASMYTGLTAKGCPDAVANLFSYGLLGKLGQELGVTINEGAQFLSQIDSIWQIFRHLVDGEFELPKIPLFKAGAEIVSMYNVIADILNPDTEEFDPMYFTYKLATGKYIPSQGKNLAKAAMMLSLGKSFNTKGNITVTDAEPYRAVLQLLGFNPIEESADRFMIQAVQDSHKTVDEFVDELKKTADAWKYYSYIEGDQEKNHQNIINLGNSFNEQHRLYLKIIKDTFGNSDVTRYFERKVGKLLDAPENTTEELKGKYLDTYNKPITDYVKFKFMENK